MVAITHIKLSYKFALLGGAQNISGRRVKPGLKRFVPLSYRFAAHDYSR